MELGERCPDCPYISLCGLKKATNNTHQTFKNFHNTIHKILIACIHHRNKDKCIESPKRLPAQKVFTLLKRLWKFIIFLPFEPWATCTRIRTRTYMCLTSAGKLTWPACNYHYFQTRFKMKTHNFIGKVQRFSWNLRGLTGSYTDLLIPHWIWCAKGRRAKVMVQPSLWEARSGPGYLASFLFSPNHVTMQYLLIYST